ncbi:hypothetical protein, partial [Moorena sp. SIO4G3]|uniref:hypothetical protein n=1 Tax=Moorena sp. SIO4G3 TaxID=2607821 RepID=UPI0025FAC439
GELVLDEYLYIIYSPLMGNCLLYWKIVLMFKHCKTCSPADLGIEQLASKLIYLFLPIKKWTLSFSPHFNN